MFLFVVALTLVVSLAAGFAPLFISLNVRTVSLLGSGVILGTSLVLVIPEGIDVMEQSGSKPLIGLPLLVGFLLMYIIDGYFKVSHQEQKQMDVNMADLRTRRFEDTEPAVTRSVPGITFGSLKKHSSLFEDLSLTTLGMIIHSAADGIALGAAYSVESPKLRFIVLLSILIHKAPAAFSLTSVLQSQGIRGMALKRDIIIFSTAAPVTAILTYLFVGSAQNFQWWAGVGLMFSGGTFTFVAVHIQPELKGYTDILLNVGGTLVPLLASFIPE